MFDFLCASGCSHLGERARLEVVKNTGHTPHLEDPSRFNELVLAFLLEAPATST